jgi:uncharacterized membrane protein
MAFCAKCGAQLAEGASFCSSCGGAVGAAPGAASGAAASLAIASNVAGCLTYILGLMTGILFLVIDPYKNDKFVRFHAFQSIFFSVAIVAFWIGFRILSTILGIISFGILGIVMGLVWLVILLVILVYWIFLMYKAYNNERYMIPYIGQLAAQQAGL